MLSIGKINDLMGLVFRDLVELASLLPQFSEFISVKTGQGNLKRREGGLETMGD